MITHDPNKTTRLDIDEQPIVLAEGETAPPPVWYELGHLTALDRMELAALAEDDARQNAEAIEAAGEDASPALTMMSIKAGWEMARRSLRGWGGMQGEDGKPLPFVRERGQRYASMETMHRIPMGHLLKIIGEVGRKNSATRADVGKS